MTLLGSAASPSSAAIPLGAAFRSAIAPALGLDPLSGFFLVVLALTAVPALVFARDYLSGSRGARAVGALTAAFLLALVGVLAARDITLPRLLGADDARAGGRDPRSPGATARGGGVRVPGDHPSRRRRGGSRCSRSRTTAPSAIQPRSPRPARRADAGGVAALIGFGTKAGLVPLHLAAARAPGRSRPPVGADVGGDDQGRSYGLIRVEFEWLGGHAAVVWARTARARAASSLGGVLWALVQHELKRLLAFHSIENVGIIALGLGASLLFADAGETTWAAIAFAAALLHVANHAIFKALLFLGAGAFERAVGTLDLDHLGGLLRRMPWTGGAFLVGAMAIAGLPPLNGFASEWLTLQSLLHVAFYGPSGSRSPARWRSPASRRPPRSRCCAS